MKLEAALAGALVGGALGDALGLPYENLSARRGKRLLGPPDRHRFVLGRGMVSDDTEHAALVVAALARSGGEPAAFERELARGLRWWVLGLPAGVGWATLRACLKLLVGVPASRSGVYSAGNGPAMRAAVLGAAASNPAQLGEWVRISTCLTHTDPKAEYGALAVALAAFQRRPVPDGLSLMAALRQMLPPNQDAAELLALLEQARQHAEQGGSTLAFAASLGLQRGVSGYVYHTVPVALHAWIRHGPDTAAAMPIRWGPSWAAWSVPEWAWTDCLVPGETVCWSRCCRLPHWSDWQSGQAGRWRSLRLTGRVLVCPGSGFPATCFSCWWFWFTSSGADCRPTEAAISQRNRAAHTSGDPVPNSFYSSFYSVAGDHL
jgi:ADP-ribosylglycohydrolase